MNHKQPLKTTKIFSDALREMLPYSQLGWEILASVGVGFGVGYCVDYFMATEPIFTLIFSILGVILSMVIVIRAVQSLNNKG